MENSKFTEAPLNTALCFVDDETTGHAWRNMCLEENRLAAILQDLPQGTAAEGEGTEIWFLKLNDEGLRELMFYYKGLEEPKSRHTIGLDWVDVGIDDLEDYTKRIQQAIANLKTKTINLDDLEGE